MSESRFLKTVLFGGYERAAVEKRFEYLTAQLFSLKNELRESKLMLAEMRKGSEAEAAAETILANERAKLTQVQVQHETVSKKIKVVEEDLRAREAEIDDLKAKIAALETELSVKTQRLIALESPNDAAALSAVFIEAQKSADLLVENAKKEAADLEANSQKLADNIIADANNSAKKIIYDAEVQSAETLADAENKSVQMQAASDNLRATVLGDVQKLSGEIRTLEEMLEQFRTSGLASLSDSSKLLTEAEAKLTAGGVPVFRVPEPVMPEFPEEPVYEEVVHTYNGASPEAVKQEPVRPDSANAESVNPEAAAPAAAPAAENTAPEAAPAPAQEKQDEDELERLRQMADSIGGGKKHKGENKPEQKKNGGHAPDLASLAAQAAALRKPRR